MPSPENSTRASTRRHSPSACRSNRRPRVCSRSPSALSNAARPMWARLDARKLTQPSRPKKTMTRPPSRAFCLSACNRPTATPSPTGRPIPTLRRSPSPDSSTVGTPSRTNSNRRPMALTSCLSVFLPGHTTTSSSSMVSGRSIPPIRKKRTMARAMPIPWPASGRRTADSRRWFSPRRRTGTKPSSALFAAGPISRRHPPWHNFPTATAASPGTNSPATRSRSIRPAYPTAPGCASWSPTPRATSATPRVSGPRQPTNSSGRTA